MALTYRLRGTTWFCRGSVRVGHQTANVPEFSTGQSSRALAEAVGAAEEARIRAELLDGPAGRARRLTIADCLEAYLGRHGGIGPVERQHVAALNEAMGDLRVEDAPEAWTAWVSAHPHHAPGTLTRYRNTLRAALKHGTAPYKVTPPPLPVVRMPSTEGQHVPMLTAPEREALLRAYNPHAAAPILLLAYCGLRTQEALQLDWREVDLPREQLRIGAGRTKTGRGRAVPLPRRPSLLLWGLWEAAGRPHRGHVFISAKGAPYANTRGQGGNPLAQAHITACARVGVRDFRIHDWRHDWAARHVMAGTDLYTLMRLGGWASLRMVQRYAAVSADHLREAALRIA